MSAKRKEVGYKIIGLTTEDTEKSGICTARREKKNMAIPLAHCFAWGAVSCSLPQMGRLMTDEFSGYAPMVEISGKAAVE